MAESSIVAIPKDVVGESELRELPQAPPTGSTATVMIDKTMSSASNLVKLLPSGTVLAFQTLSPSFANKGACYASSKCLTSALVLLCAVSCVFFSFTDSLLGDDGKLYYGIATPRGFYLFNYDDDDDDESKSFKNLRRFRLRLIDYAHAALSVVVFLSLAFSDSDIQSCLFAGSGPNTKELLVNLPLGAAVVSSLVFVVLPTSRKGIGYSDATPHSQ